MKKLVLYSDQLNEKCGKIDQALLQILTMNNPKIGYIPSCSDLTKQYFNQKIKYYKKIGITNLVYFDLDEEFENNKMEDLFNCDAIHLSGGNTFYFLKLIQERNLIDKLKSYIQNGGVLIGISAGSILMSKTISSAKLIDENFIELTDLNSLGLTDFDFFPHWDDDDYLIEIINYSKMNKDKVCYVCRDTDGIIVDNDNVTTIGNPVKILNGIVNKV